MTNENAEQRLARLKRDANRSLRLFTRRNIVTPTGSQSRTTTRGRSLTPRSIVASVSTSGTGVDSGEVNVNVNLAGGAVFLDDERRVRALAKEIKRLITEDRRRGLGV